MTGKERILDALAGRRPDRVPFVPNVWQWFYVNQSRGALPERLKDFSDPIDVLKFMEADVFSKFDGKALAETFHCGNRTVRYQGERLPGHQTWSSFADFAGGSVRKEAIHTPLGALTHVWKYEPLAGGECVTKLLVFAGKTLVMNFSTSAAGSVRVEMQNDKGKPIPGFTLAECPETFGDAIEQPVSWKSGADVSRLSGTPVRLRFVMKDADLYSIRFRP